MLDYALAAVVGIATIASPCILPVLPIVLATTAGPNRVEPLLITVGFVLSFALGGILIEMFERSIDLLVSRLRQRQQDDARDQSYIKTLRSEGYVFSMPVTLAGEGE